MVRPPSVAGNRGLPEPADRGGESGVLHSLPLLALLGRLAPDRFRPL